MTKAILRNYLTTISACLATLALRAAGSGMCGMLTLLPVLKVIGGIGVVGLGIVAQAFNRYSNGYQSPHAEAN
jgi:hypothetical protein